MSDRYKFTKDHGKDQEIRNIQREIEDKMATRDELDNKYEKVTKISGEIPRLSDLADGETKLCVLGDTKRRYYRVGSRLFYSTLTEV